MRNADLARPVHLPSRWISTRPTAPPRLVLLRMDALTKSPAPLLPSGPAAQLYKKMAGRVTVSAMRLHLHVGFATSHEMRCSRSGLTCSNSSAPRSFTAPRPCTSRKGSSRSGIVRAGCSRSRTFDPIRCRMMVSTHRHLRLTPPWGVLSGLAGSVTRSRRLVMTPRSARRRGEHGRIAEETKNEDVKNHASNPLPSLLHARGRTAAADDLSPAAESAAHASPCRVGGPSAAGVPPMFLPGDVAAERPARRAPTSRSLLFKGATWPGPRTGRLKKSREKIERPSGRSRRAESQSRLFLPSRRFCRCDRACQSPLLTLLQRSPTPRCGATGF